MAIHAERQIAIHTQRQMATHSERQMAIHTKNKQSRIRTIKLEPVDEVL